jgi:hypothetical protein
MVSGEGTQPRVVQGQTLFMCARSQGRRGLLSSECWVVWYEQGGAWNVKMHSPVQMNTTSLRGSAISLA